MKIRVWHVRYVARPESKDRLDVRSCLQNLKQYESFLQRVHTDMKLPVRTVPCKLRRFSRRVTRFCLPASEEVAASPGQVLSLRHPDSGWPKSS